MIPYSYKFWYPLDWFNIFDIGTRPGAEIKSLFLKKKNLTLKEIT